MKIELTEGSEVTVTVDGCSLSLKLRRHKGTLCGIIIDAGADSIISVARDNQLLLTNDSSYVEYDKIKEFDDDTTVTELLGDDLINLINKAMK